MRNDGCLRANIKRIEYYVSNVWKKIREPTLTIKVSFKTIVCKWEAELSYVNDCKNWNKAPRLKPRNIYHRRRVKRLKTRNEIWSLRKFSSVGILFNQAEDWAEEGAKKKFLAIRNGQCNFVILRRTPFKNSNALALASNKNVQIWLFFASEFWGCKWLNASHSVLKGWQFSRKPFVRGLSSQTTLALVWGSSTEREVVRWDLPNSVRRPSVRLA